MSPDSVCADSVAEPALNQVQDPQEVRAIVASHGGQPSALLSILGDIQNRYRYLPADALRIVAESTGSSLVDVYGVATFYRSFSLKPKGKHLICACLGTACHVRGGPIVASEFERQLGIEAGQTTADQEFTLETMNCLGACALGPIVVADARVFSNVSIRKVGDILEGVRRGPGEAGAAQALRAFALEVTCPHCRAGLMNAHYLDGSRSIQLETSYGRKRSYVRLSAVYGSDAVRCGQTVPAGVTVDLVCPECHTSLLGDTRCLECEAPMAEMPVKAGATLRVCSRAGCWGRALDLGAAGAAVRAGHTSRSMKGASSRRG